MVSRIDAYTHNVSPNTAGGAMVRVQVQTDFAAKGEEFVAFVKQLAIQAYVHGQTNWAKLCDAAPELKAQYDELVKTIKEKVVIDNITVYLSPDQQAALEKEGTPATAFFE